VVSGSPAEKSGIKRGDVITKVGDLEIKDANDLLNRIALLLPNQTVDIRVIRDGITLTFKTRIARRDENRLALAQGDGEDQDSPAYVGLKVAAPTPELARRYGLDGNPDQGVIVVSVEEVSRAAKGKIRAGDVISEINRAPVRNLAEFRAAMIQAGKGNKILMLISRKGKTLYLGL
jgi:S1-C subfamily serine protease